MDKAWQDKLDGRKNLLDPKQPIWSVQSKDILYAHLGAQFGGPFGFKTDLGFGGGDKAGKICNCQRNKPVVIAEQKVARPDSTACNADRHIDGPIACPYRAARVDMAGIDRKILEAG